MARPYFSIITCTKNSRQYIRECLDSVSNQAFSNYEHLIVDGQSSDGTADIIKEYQKRDGRIKLYTLVPNGISAAMNFGIKKSTGTIINHLHSDDLYFNSNVLTLVSENFSKGRHSWIIGDCEFFGNVSCTVFPDSEVKKWFLFHFPFMYLLKDNKVPHPSVFLKKDIYLRNGLFDESLQTVMDYEYWLRIVHHEKVLFLDTPISRYRAHADTVSNKYESIAIKESRRILEYYGNKYRGEHVLSVIMWKLLNVAKIFL